ncbi:hypothetical protein DPEC_G00244050 [Dallia pectoralis]|uniref:Uncharacterized protein n=1 Tax=Dallia pectoralis TaxID=75939 RepID=A0ACC2FVP6_DALPE|nr:hypothetical protein DPEC_G00244050 [Dallia pectoralis]
MALLWLVFMGVLGVFGAEGDQTLCQMLGYPEFPLFSKEGDVTIGGVFTIHGKTTEPPLFFTDTPQPLTCSSINLREFRFAQTMIFAIEEINNSFLLPNISIGYRIYDGCGSSLSTLRASMGLMNGQERTVGKSCFSQSAVHAIIGSSESSTTIAMSQSTGAFQIPVISHFATCACLSNKKEFPTFFRTIPSDFYQSRALAKLVKHFGWTWVGAIRSDNDYGNYGMANFIKAAGVEGVCIEYSETILLTSTREQIAMVVSVISRASSKVLVAFVSYLEMEVLLEEVLAQNLTGLQWVASESWITDTHLATRYSSILGGTLGFAIRQVTMPGLREFLLRVGPAQDTNNALLREFWEVTFGCRWSPQKDLESWQKKCTGFEKLDDINNPFTDISELRISNNVYKAVYAVAQSIHDMLNCRYDVRNCTHSDSIKPGESGERIYFDENGDPEATYDLVNWQRNEAEEMSFVTVGYYNASLPNQYQFALTGANITWAGDPLKKACQQGELEGSMPQAPTDEQMCSWASIKLPVGQSVEEHSPGLQSDSRLHKQKTQIGYKDIIKFGLGAITEDHYKTTRINLREFRFAQTMIFAIEEINNSFLLPNISIGYRIYDGCGSSLSTLRASMGLMNGQERTVGKSCFSQSAVHAIIGSSESSTTIAMSQSTGAFQIPVISHFATCACLSNKKEFPTFFRTIPSDFYQSRALAKLVKHFGWTWVGAIRSDNDYGNYGMANFIKAAGVEGVCIEYSETILLTSPREQIAMVVTVISRASSKVLVAFVSQLEMEVLLEEALAQNLTGLQWVASESWITDTHLATRYSSILGGTLGFAIRQVTMPGLREFLLRVGPAQDTNNALLREFWEVTFGCRWSPQKDLESWQKKCSGSEKLDDINNPFTDISERRVSNNVYKAVYAVAQSIHNLLNCRYDVRNCTHSDSIKPGESGERIYFDENGDPEATYDLVNWQRNEAEEMSFVTVGYYNASLPNQYQFALTGANITWAGDPLKVLINLENMK